MYSYIYILIMYSCGPLRVLSTKSAHVWFMYFAIEITSYFTAMAITGY